MGPAVSRRLAGRPGMTRWIVGAASAFGALLLPAGVLVSTATTDLETVKSTPGRGQAWSYGMAEWGWWPYAVAAAVIAAFAAITVWVAADWGRD